MMPTPHVLLLAASLALAGCGTRPGASDSSAADVVAAADLGGRPDSSPRLEETVDGKRYEADLFAIAAPRPHGSPHWKLVQDLCFDRLSQLGFETERASYGTGTNVVGRLPGAKQPARQVIISAHYDSVPACAGADDNASGVAGALEAARVLATVKHDRTLVVACWDEEETGILGSDAYAAAARQRGDEIRFAYVLDMIGYKSDEPSSQTMPWGMELLWPAEVAAIKANQMRADFIVACFDESAASKSAVDELVARAKLVGLPLYPMILRAALKDLPELKDLYRGDHAPFWQRGYPAAMINDTSSYRKTNYHCKDGPDTADRLSIEFSTKIVKSVVGSAQTLLRAD
jgi:Zn-dependent M28 family amino/carboxypeptidase